MKFANKLFFMTTTVLMLIFAIFGTWMLSSYFNKTLNREMEQADTENRMFQYLFEIASQSVMEYGEDYAIKSAVDSVAASVEKDGSQCFVWSKEKQYYGDVEGSKQQLKALDKLVEEMDGVNTFACGIRQLDDRYYLLSVCESQTNDASVYLGISKDITAMYEDRKELLEQYHLALSLLLLLGGISIYILSQRITKPIRTLDMVVGQIADGNYEQRSEYRSNDEIGKLANNFNHMADRLMEQVREKEKEAEQKESFMTAFAHELKTPLTSIIGYADMLNTVTLSEEEQREAYYYIFNQGKRLESLSHKLLELVCMDKTIPKTEAINTKELEKNLKITMRPVFAQKHIKGKIAMEKGIIHGDRDLLLSVFYNLLDNAVKAVGVGGVILLKGKCLSNGYEVYVIDNGCGIPEQEIDRITEAFYMVDKSRSRKEGGAGIGMALCQKIVSLYKGELQIKSVLGEGTTIQVVFTDNVRAE